jgi:peptidylprolyl isomerase
MKNIFYSILLLTSPANIEQVSEALGHLIGKHIENLNLPLDLNALAKGIEEEKEGRDSPLNEEDCLEAIADLQKIKNRELEKVNLKLAEDFLTKNEKVREIKTLLDGKLQYQIKQAGSGQQVQSYNSPIVRISGRYLDGKPFSISHEEELLTLDESIPAFRQGVQGMKEGEVRTLYVHPDIGYGQESHLHPGALLIFDVEVIRADAATDAEIADHPQVETSIQ